MITEVQKLVWVIYPSKTGDELLKKFNDEQVEMIKDFIDPFVLDEVVCK